MPKLTVAVAAAGILAGCGAGDSTVAKTPQGSAGDSSSAASSTAASGTATTPADPCAIDLGAEEIANAVAKLPDDPRSHQPWNPEPLAGNYNKCTQLSAVVVAANTNAARPNTTAVMFHHGRHIPDGVPDTYGFDDLDLSQCTDDIVALRASSGIAGLASVVKLRWNNNSVELIGNTG